MNFNDDKFADDKDSQKQGSNNQPNAYRVDDDDTNTIEEKDLEKTFLFGKGDDPAHPTEGKGTGGQNFGQNNLTPSGNDQNNPSQTAGNNNGYFARTEPSEEHPEDTNFTALGQNGAPDYGSVQSNASGSEPKPEKAERGNGENDRPHTQEDFNEGTADNDGNGNAQPNIPGPNELPDQQKVGEGNDDDGKDHIET